jgi:uncharacterized protein YndB with AHSA1/START domain
MSQRMDELAVRRSVFVRCTPERAFHVYTERTNDWYSPAGEEGVWGTITEWDPPHGFAMTWHPGRGEETAQELAISFTAEGDGTRVEVVHTGWERVGPDFRERMTGYEKGWGAVLDSFADEAGKAA